MADWSQLPGELIDLITQHLDTESDLLRFKSVCTTWRSSPSSNPLSLPPRFPILPNKGISSTSWGFYLSKRTIFSISEPEPRITPSSSNPDSFFKNLYQFDDSISSPEEEQHLMNWVETQNKIKKLQSRKTGTSSWIVKIEQDTPNVTHLLNPLSRFQYNPKVIDGFPTNLDLRKFKVTELGQEYILQYINYRPFASSINDAGNLYMEKVALCNYPGIGYVLLTIHVSGKLALFRIGDNEWTVIKDMPSPYDDVISFQGKFYAVDNTGRIVNLNFDDSSSPVVELVVNPVFGGDKKALVMSCGELLLVDTYLSMRPEDDVGFEEEVEFYEEYDCYMSERTVRFKVFRMETKEKKWVEVKDLGDQLLFLGYYSTFSASSKEFYGCKGNCIIFADHNFYSNREEEDGVTKGRGVGLFDLESGFIWSLSNYPGYSKFFWPPPSWVSSTMLEGHLDQLRM